MFGTTPNVGAVGALAAASMPAMMSKGAAKKQLSGMQVNPNMQSKK